MLRLRRTCFLFHSGALAGLGTAPRGSPDIRGEPLGKLTLPPFTVSEPATPGISLPVCAATRLQAHVALRAPERRQQDDHT